MPDAVRVYLNPLSWVNVDIADHAGDGLKADWDSLAEFLACPAASISIQVAIERYRRITQESAPIQIAPEHPEVLRKLIWPLRSAKSSYVVGNLVSTIAQAGMVAEMVALLWFEISSLHINDRLMDRDSEKLLFGRGGVESLGQERRAEVLAGLGIIGPEQKAHFDTIQKLRRRYLHFFSQQHNNIDNDAIIVFRSAAALVSHLIDITIENGKVRMRPPFLSYVEAQGNREPSSGQMTL